MRLFVAVIAALAVTLALFWFMQWMIASGDREMKRPEDRLQVEIVRVERDEQVIERDRQPPRPPEQQERPPPPPMEHRAVRPDVGGVGMGTPRIEGNLGGMGPGHLQEGDPMPVAAIAPQYPREALISGIEGWVRVEFTIEADGSVSGARVVDAHPRRGVFDRDALRAIQRWRFRPRVRDGEPVASRAGYTIEFKLDES